VNKLKVAYLFGSLNRGGTETLMLDFFKEAKNVNFEIIGIYRKNGELLHDYKNTGVELFQLKPKNIFDLFYFLKLRKLLTSNKISIAHAQQAIDALYAWCACLGTGIKIVLTFHSYNLKYFWLAHNIAKFIIRKTDLNIFVSKSQRAYCQKKYSLKSSHKQHVIYNGISFDKFDNDSNKSIRSELNISENILLLGSVGNFTAGKDQMTICRFLNLLNKENVDFAFLFVGEKSNKEPWYYDDCVQYCKDKHLSGKVLFLGSRNDVPNILNQLDAFIYSSNHDTFGIAVIEAMAMGIPVFVNDWEVMKEITENGNHGKLFKTRNEHDLYSKFSQFLQNKEAFIQKSKKDAVWARQKYDISRCLKELRNIYAELLSY
jgi:glycosyltransferase involved in cell wall biosynthesis